MKSYQMDSGSGNKRSQTGKKVQRIKDNMGGSVAIRSFKFINHLAFVI